QAPTNTRLAMQLTRNAWREGRARNTTASTSWSHPATAKLTPAGSHSALWVGTIARWIAPAAADSAATRTSAARLHPTPSPSTSSGAADAECSMMAMAVPPPRRAARAGHAPPRFNLHLLETQWHRAGAPDRPVDQAARIGRLPEHQDRGEQVELRAREL